MSNYTVVIGLGNIGKEYERTRHNAGFMLLDSLKNQWRLDMLQQTATSNNLVESIKYPSRKLVLAKPQTMMNRSGSAVAAVMKQLPKETRLIVAYDDLDISLGSYKIQQDKAPKQHNGINSIIASIGTADFTHVRIGVENRTSMKIAGVDYVLGRFNDEEREQINEVFIDIGAELEALL